MTGRYPQRFGYEFNPDGSPEYGLPLTETTMADRLKAAGYRTALFGKWHLGSADRLHPMRRGFDEFYGFLGGDHSYVNVAHIDPGTNMPDPLLDGMKPASLVTYLTDTLGDRAVAYIKRHASSRSFSISRSTLHMCRWKPLRRTSLASRTSRIHNAIPMLPWCPQWTMRLGER